MSEEKLNPATGRPQPHVPFSKLEELENLNEKLQSTLINDGQNSAFSDEEKLYFATTAFAMVNTKYIADQIPFEEEQERTKELSEELGEIGQGYDDELSFWFTELIQNAMDATWERGIGAENIILNICNEYIEFQHDGRPPHYRNEKIGHNVDGNELRSMIRRSSTKKGNLATEGRFGIGFKFWINHFNSASLSAEGWHMKWGKTLAGNPITLEECDKNGVMVLTFEEPNDSARKKLEEYCNDSKELINSLGRLFSGLAMLPRECNFTIQINGETEWKIEHNYLQKREGRFGYFENVCDQGNISQYIPEKVLIYNASSIEKLDPDLTQFLRHSIVDEMRRKGTSTHSVRRLLNNFGYENPDDFERCAQDAAEGTVKDIQLKVAIDMTNYSVSNLQEGGTLAKHFLLHSMFPIGNPDRRNWEGTSARVNLIAPFKLTHDRTKLEQNEKRNFALAALLINLWNQMMDELSIPKKRSHLGINLRLYGELLQFVNDRGGDELFDLLNNWTDAFTRYLDSQQESDRNGEESVNFDHNFSVMMSHPMYPSSSGVHLQWDDSYKIREDIEQLLKHENNDVQLWAKTNIHPKETCLVVGESLVPIHSRFIDRNDLNINSRVGKAIFEKWNPKEMPAPGGDVSRTVALELNKMGNGWPEWLPLPVKEAGTRQKTKWKLPVELKNSIVLKIQNSRIDLEDDFEKAVHKEATENFGMKIYELCPEWEPLYRTLREIRGIPLVEGDDNIIFEKCIENIVEAGSLAIKKLKELAIHFGQNKKRWPVLMQDSDGDLLLVRKPDPMWNHALVAVNDVRENVFDGNGYPKIRECDEKSRKTLWVLSENDVFQSISQRDDENIKERWPKMYIETLDYDEKFSHMIISENGTSEFLDAYKETIVDMGELKSYNGKSVEFSPIRESFDEVGARMAEFNCVLAKPLKNTDPSIIRMVKKELPGLPSLIHAVFLPYVEDEWDVELPVHTGQRKHNHWGSEPPKSHGFLRHVLRVVNEATEEDYHSNLHQTKWLSPDSRTGKNNQKWSEEHLIGNQPIKSSSNYGKAKGERNYALLIRTITPQAAAFELANNCKEGNYSGKTIRKCLLLASHSHSPQHLSTSRATHRKRTGAHAHMNNPFDYWIAYWTKDEGNKGLRKKLMLEHLDHNERSHFGGLTPNSNSKLTEPYKEKPRLLAGLGNNEILKANSFAVTTTIGSEQQKISHSRNVWSENPQDGKLVEMMAEMLAEKKLMPIDSLMLRDGLSQNQHMRVKAFLSGDSELNEMQLMDSCSEDEQKVARRWLLNPAISTFDSNFSDLIEKGIGDENQVAVLRIPFLVWEEYERIRKSVGTSHDDETEEDVEKRVDQIESDIENRLVAWRGEFVKNDFKLAIDKGFIGEEFVKKMFDSEGSAETSSLTVRLRNANTTASIRAELRKEVAKARVLQINQMTEVWVIKKGIGAAEFNEKVRIYGRNDSEMKQYMGIQENMNNPQSGFYSSPWGFSLVPQKVMVLPLTKNEMKEVVKKEALVGNEIIKKEHFFRKSKAELDNYFLNALNRENQFEHYGIKIKDQGDWQFLANSLSYLAAKWFIKQEGTEIKLSEFLCRLGEIEIDDQLEWNQPIHDDSPYHLGNGGWSIQKHKLLRLQTARNKLGTNGMKEKIGILKGLLIFCDGGEDDDVLLQRDFLFKESFDLTDIDEPIIHDAYQPSPFSERVDDRDAWYEQKVRAEPDQKFENLISEPQKWMSWESAERLVDAGEIKNWISTWFRETHEQKMDNVEILKQLYPGFSCTIISGHDSDQFSVPSLEDGEESAREIIRIQGHDGDYGKNPITDYPYKKREFGEILRHYGNMLYVSAQQSRNGSRQNGWTIRQPRESQAVGFFSWLTKGKLRSLWDDQIDNDYVILKGVIYPPNYDPKHDGEQDLVVHKLHLLYIYAYEEVMKSKRS